MITMIHHACTNSFQQKTKKYKRKKVKLKQNGPNLHTFVKDKIHHNTIKKFQSQNRLQN